MVNSKVPGEMFLLGCLYIGKVGVCWGGISSAVQCSFFFSLVILCRYFDCLQSFILVIYICFIWFHLFVALTSWESWHNSLLTGWQSVALGQKVGGKWFLIAWWAQSVGSCVLVVTLPVERHAVSFSCWWLNTWKGHAVNAWVKLTSVIELKLK